MEQYHPFNAGLRSFMDILHHFIAFINQLGKRNTYQPSILDCVCLSPFLSLSASRGRDPRGQRLQHRGGAHLGRPLPPLPPLHLGHTRLPLSQVPVGSLWGSLTGPRHHDYQPKPRPVDGAMLGHICRFSLAEWPSFKYWGLVAPYLVPDTLKDSNWDREVPL